MEKLEKKHNHKLTDLLKVGIFGIMLTLPFAVYTPNALYYGTNEYAVAQEKTEQIPVYYDTNEVNNFNDIHIGSIYQYTDNFVMTPELQNKTFANIKYLDVYSQLSNDLDTTQPLVLYGGANNLTIRQTINNVTTSVAISNLTLPMVFEVINGDLSLIWSYFVKYNGNYIKEYASETYTMSIAESMNIAWQQTWESQMFNWTNTSILKQSLDNFTGVFGVTDTSYFTNLLVYELIMIAIYIVIDIIIETFKWLTHLIGAK